MAVRNVPRSAATLMAIRATRAAADGKHANLPDAGGNYKLLLSTFENSESGWWRKWGVSPVREQKAEVLTVDDAVS